MKMTLKDIVPRREGPKMPYRIPVTKKVAIVFRWGSLWIGAHWSDEKRQWCINLVPCVTLRIRL